MVDKASSGGAPGPDGQRRTSSSLSTKDNRSPAGVVARGSGWGSRTQLGEALSGSVERTETRMEPALGWRRRIVFHLAVAKSRNFTPLRVLPFRGFGKDSLHGLYIGMGQLRGSRFVELERSAQLRTEFWEAGSWETSEHALTLLLFFFHKHK
jgi:hypothetical protein